MIHDGAHSRVDDDTIAIADAINASINKDLYSRRFHIAKSHMVI
jgi:hypothetical protein